MRWKQCFTLGMAWLLVLSCFFLIGERHSLAAPGSQQTAWGLSWVADFNNLTPVADQPALYDLILLETAYSVARDGWRLVALNRNDGQIRWSYQPGKSTRSSNLLAYRNGIALALNDQRVVVLNPKTGEIKEQIELPERNAGLLNRCGDNLCMVMGDFKAPHDSAIRSLFMRSSPRKVWEPELAIYSPASKSLIKRFPFHRHEILPAGIALEGNLVTLVMPGGPIEIYNLASNSFMPSGRYEIMRADWMIQDNRVVWLEAGQVFRVDLSNSSVALPSMLPAGSRELIALRYPNVFFARQQKDGYAVWRIDVKTGESQQIFSSPQLSAPTHVEQGNSLLFLSRNEALAFDMQNQQILARRRLPWLEDTLARPVAVSANDALAVVELAQGYQIFRLAPMDKLPDSGPPPTFGEPLDAVSGYRLLQNLSVERQWEAARTALSNQIRKQDTFPARCHCMADYGGEEVARIRAHRMLLSRNRYFVPLAMGELELLEMGDASQLLQDLYFATQTALGRELAELNPAAERMGKNWPKDWKREDILRFSAWTLQKLEAFGYEQVAPIYRKQLQSDSFGYAEQLDSFRYLLGHYEQEKSLLNDWFKKRFHWQNEQPSLDRSVISPDPVRFLATARDKRRELGLFFMDFPVRHSLWLFLKKRGKSKGNIYFTGYQLSPARYQWLMKERERLAALTPKKAGKSTPPIKLILKGAHAIITLNRSKGERYFKVKLTEMTSDVDHDGWTDLEESIIGLNNNKADSDQDGIPDGRDANPLVASLAQERLTDAQQIAQAVMFHGCQVDPLPPEDSWLGGRRFLRSIWLDFESLPPVELPGCGQVFMPPRKGLKALDICRFKPVLDDGKSLPKSLTKKGPVSYSEDGQQAWIGLQCGNKFVQQPQKNYNLQRLLDRWIVIEQLQ